MVPQLLQGRRLHAMGWRDRAPETSLTTGIMTTCKTWHSPSKKHALCSTHPSPNHNYAPSSAPSTGNHAATATTANQDTPARCTHGPTSPAYTKPSHHG